MKDDMKIVVELLQMYDSLPPMKQAIAYGFMLGISERQKEETK